MSALRRKLFCDFRSLGLQVLTIAVLIVGGVSVLVSSWSSYQSLQKSKDNFYIQFGFADIFAEVVRAPESLVQKINQIKGIEKTESRIIKDGLVDVSGQVEPVLGRFISWSGEHQEINKIYLRQGRMPQVSSRGNSQIEVVVHESFATAHHLKMGDKLKVLLEGQKRKLVISGIGLSPEYVYVLSPVAPLPDDKHFGVFWMHQQDLESLTGMDGAFNSLQIRVSEEAPIKELSRQIDIILQPYGNIQSYGRSKQLSNMFVEDEINQQKVMAYVMPSIFLSVAIFILNVILSRIISLQRSQIATLKALGYSAWVLTFHYFQLITLILLTGIGPALLIGSWIGSWYADLYKDFFRFPEIDFTLSLSSVIVGITAGLIPGWLGAFNSLLQVFSLQPAEALKPPNPPPFQKGLFEKLKITKYLSVSSKMILRSLLFRPIRLLMSIIGMAAAIAILINGSFWNDVMDFMMERQFQEMHREDLSIQLLHPKNLSIYSEIKKIQGVLMVEGERSVPVRLTYSNMSKEISIKGLNASSQLSRVLDFEGNIINPIPGGVILSRYFQKEYNLKVGEHIHMKSLEGTQQEFSAPVMGFVDDLIGQQAYVTKNDLHRWLREEPVIDTLQIRIDPQYAERIYVKLKEKPEVVGVSIRGLLIKSFTATVSNMILTFTFILYGFAVAIAGAVIYNSVRIGFSERSWELASLRILGFGVGQTFEVLFVDIGLQVLISLIPGLSLGYWLSLMSTTLIHNETFNFPLIIDLSTYGAAVVVLMLTFFASGIYLYFKVVKLNFSEALKARE